MLARYHASQLKTHRKQGFTTYSTNVSWLCATEAFCRSQMDDTGMPNAASLSPAAQRRQCKGDKGRTRVAGKGGGSNSRWMQETAAEHKTGLTRRHACQAAAATAACDSAHGMSAGHRPVFNSMI
jgi:hypothetical protein